MRNEEKARFIGEMTHPDCECHKWYGESLTCDITCIKCSGATKVVKTETEDYKKIEVTF